MKRTSVSISSLRLRMIPQADPVRIESGLNLCELHQVPVEADGRKDIPRFEENFCFDHLQENQTVELKTLLQRWNHVLSCGSLDIGYTHDTELYKHHIDLSDTTPFLEHSRRIPPGLFQEVKQHLQQMLDADVIEESSSPFASNMVLVRKRDSSLRLCVDYRKLNRRTIPDSHSLPRIEETLDALQGASWFSTVDLKSGYYQMGLHEEHKERTAFTAGPLGLFQFKRLPFGLRNAPASFQRLMQHVLGDLYLKICFVILDDIIIFSRSFEEHVQHLELVFRKLAEAGLKLHPDKCQFCFRKLLYVGHVVSQDGIECNPEFLRAVKEYPVPRSVKELQQFLGFANFYRRFIQNFAQIASPLYGLLGGRKPKGVKRSAPEWKWSSSHQNAFDQLIECLTNPPLLAYPEYTKPFLLRTDASKLGLGAVLCQEREGRFHVIAYASRALHGSEKNYSAHKLEFLAVKWAVTNKFHDYLYGHPFTITTDHNPLTYILSTAKLDSVGHRWLADLSAFDFDILYKPGKSNVDGDVLSQLPRHDSYEQSGFKRISSQEVRDLFQDLQDSTGLVETMVVTSDLPIPQESTGSLVLTGRLNNKEIMLSRMSSCHFRTALHLMLMSALRLSASCFG